MIKKDTVKPGFVRVFIPARNKTILIREQHARNPNYMNRNGLVAMPTAQPIPTYTPPPPIQVMQSLPFDAEPTPPNKKRASPRKITDK